MVLYDGSFEGLLSAVFEIFEYKITDPRIQKKESASPSFFGKVHTAETCLVKAERVYKKLRQLLTANGVAQLYKTHLSEISGIEDHIYRYIAYALSSKTPVENNFAHPDILMVQQTSRKVHREKHRMEAFVRFQLTKDGLYYAIIQPDFNVLPLIAKHFEDRYADQRWLIYDCRRGYGLYYDLEQTAQVSLHFTADLDNPQQLAAIADEHEALYQSLWQQYFGSVNIAARKNTKLHIRHMPKRYWRYLVEKRGSINGEY